MREKPGPARGVLTSVAASVAPNVGVHERWLPCSKLLPSVAHFWWVQWALDKPMVVSTLPHPSAHLVFDFTYVGDQPTQIEATFGGVSTKRFTRTLMGHGAVLGVKFRPAMFWCWPKSMSLLTEKVHPIETLFGNEHEALNKQLLQSHVLDNKISTIEQFLLERLTNVSAERIQIRDLVEKMSTDSTITQVQQLTDLMGRDIRWLQRVFQRYVGVSPKWVIQRFRMHEAAERLKAGAFVSLASLAQELGYCDQPHFVKDFRSVVGKSPSEFLRTGA